MVGAKGRIGIASGWDQEGRWAGRETLNRRCDFLSLVVRSVIHQRKERYRSKAQSTQVELTWLPGSVSAAASSLRVGGGDSAPLRHSDREAGLQSNLGELVSD